MQEIKNNRHVYSTQEGMQEIKNNPQVYTSQQGIKEIQNESSGIHYPRGYATD